MFKKKVLINKEITDNMANHDLTQISKKFQLVGDNIELTLYDFDKDMSEVIFSKFYSEALRLQKIFNFYDKTSELSRLNQKRNMKCSKELAKVIKLSIKFSKFTKGEYDAAKGKEFLSRKKDEEKKVNCSYKDVLIKGNVLTLENDDVLIDLGSVAKGYIGDKLTEFLKNEGVESGFIDLRGDMISFGKHTENMSIQHPRDKEKTIYSFNLKSESVATSGDYNQYYNNDYDKSHIINKKDIISVTVVHKKLAVADALATAIFVCGSKNLKKFSKEKYLVITKDLKMIKSKGFPDNN